MPFKVVDISHYVPSSVLSVFSVVQKMLTTEGTEKRLWALTFDAITHILYGVKCLPL